MSVQDLVEALCDKYHPLVNSAIQEMGLLFVIDEKGKGEVQGQSARQQVAVGLAIVLRSASRPVTAACWRERSPGWIHALGLVFWGVSDSSPWAEQELLLFMLCPTAGSCTFRRHPGQSNAEKTALFMIACAGPCPTPPHLPFTPRQCLSGNIPC